MHIAVNVRFLLPGDKLEGIGRFTLETLRELVRQQPQHTFHFLFDRPFDARYVLGPNVVAHVLGPPARHPLLWLAWFEGAVARWLARHKPAVFLSPDGYTTLRTRVPRVTVLHDLAFEHFPQDVSWLVRAYYRYFTPRFAQASARLVAVSEATKQDVVARYGIAPEKIRVVYNAAAWFQPQPAPLQQATRERYAAGHPYYLFVGALQPRKNLPNLLRAFDAFKTATGSAARLLVVGRTAWQAGPVFEVYRGLRHRAAVHLTGRVTDEELTQLYAAARATCYVPYFEGFGLPVIEAQACGSPVITSNRSSLPEVAGPGAACLVDPHSVESITAGLVRVEGSEEYRQELIEAGFRNGSRFSWAESARRLWQEIERAAELGGEA